jgi:hypothetical protein
MSYINRGSYIIQQGSKENSYNHRYSTDKDYLKLPPADIVRNSQLISVRKSTKDINSNLFLPLIPTNCRESIKKIILTDKPFPLLNLLSNREFKHVPSESYLNNFMLDHLMKRKIFEFEYKDKNFIKKANKENLLKKSHSISKLNISNSSSNVSGFSNQNSTNPENFKAEKIKDLISSKFPIFLFSKDVKEKSKEKKNYPVNSEQNKMMEDLYRIKKSDDILIKKAKIQLFKIKKKDYLKSKNNF